jgi:hypothetical protein
MEGLFCGNASKTHTTAAWSKETFHCVGFGSSHCAGPLEKFRTTWLSTCGNTMNPLTIGRRATRWSPGSPTRWKDPPSRATRWGQRPAKTRASPTQRKSSAPHDGTRAPCAPLFYPRALPSISRACAIEASLVSPESIRAISATRSSPVTSSMSVSGESPEDLCTR